MTKRETATLVIVGVIVGGILLGTYAVAKKIIDA